MKDGERYTGIVKAYYGSYDSEGKFIPDTNRPKYEFHMKDGVLHGEYREWWNNGKMRYFIEYDNSFRNGLFLSYNNKGHLVRRRMYNEGREVICG